ncbi:hypothetical protein BU24DRAFT_365699 [Aaosphaeria arxii CBS 175.79]|uniref:Hamartin n=1 Tax=Aaosphaeria arxii CBS 175.79 TaxID=1450172 RepID=A0A6A5Y516_9PLEO|nr:uncharacterized protein BU24DRAFT_365699 [Aaosphaeria arxii CBS 175.79]KAF2019941.1 hypothetical protein BU24DRAFT_365699 [Aaosphaeria arxii CBS 175.79]
MASGSMRETIKVLNSTFSAPTAPYPLPDEIIEAIETFLEKYSEIEDHDSQRFHDDLLPIYTKHVAPNPDKLGSFLSVLRLVRPALTGETRLEDWWRLVLQPTIDNAAHKRREIDDVRQIIQHILIYDADEDKDGAHSRLSGHFLKRLIDAYLSRTKLPSSPEETISLEDDLISHELETILVAYGRSKPKELLLVVDRLFVQRQYRIQALNLLSAFVRLQPPHLYLVLETPLIQHLEKCLLIDTSETVIEMALMTLIMFLPHIAGSLPTDHHLAKLFLVYSRLICWDKYDVPLNAENKEHDGEMTEDEYSDEEEIDQSWEKATHAEGHSGRSLTILLHYFTFLYGLYPLNFMSFTRKARKYLKSLDFPGADDFELDQDLIHSRTEQYRRVHLLHPNMFTTTIEDELKENRWLKSDPADIVTECMDLCIAVSTTLDDPGPPPSTRLPDLPVPPPVPGTDVPSTEDTGNEAAVSWRNTQSTMFAPSATGPPEDADMPPKPKSVKSSKSASPLLKGADIMDSPTLPPVKEKQDFLGTSLLPPHHLGSSPPRIGALAHVLGSGSVSPTHSEYQNQSMASLQREIMLLRNDLNFERYLKQQHLVHIGQLQRKHIKEATAEAETQNLINTNRTLKARLAKANELYAQLKKETLTSRSQSKKWEGELSAKVRSYRDEQKAWQSDEGNLRHELTKSQQDCEHLKKMIEKAEAERLQAQQRARALEAELEDYGNLRHQLEVVQEKVISYEGQTKDLAALMRERNQLRNDLEVANLRLNSRELERERSFKAYERHIGDLEKRLQAAEKTTSKSGQLPPSVQQMLDSTMAANNAKLQQMKNTHYRLLDRYTDLEMKYHDLEAERQAELGRVHAERQLSHPESPESQVQGLGLSRNFSLRQSSIYTSKYPPLSTTEESPIVPEDYDYYPDYHSPTSMPSPTTPASPPRPVRMESLPTSTSSNHHYPRIMVRDTVPTVGLGHDFSAAYDASLNAHLQAAPASAPPEANSSGKSTFSLDTNSSKGDSKKDKVVPKSEVRVYGRGGAQNIGKKVKEDKEKDKAKKSGSTAKPSTFRGLRLGG